MIWELFGIIFLIWFIINYIQHFRSWNDERLPPGPRNLLAAAPFLSLNPLEAFQNWKDLYGPITFVPAIFYSVVIINDSKLTKMALSQSSFNQKLDMNFIKEGTDGGKGIIWSEPHISAEQRRFIMKKIKDLGSVGDPINVRIQEEVQALVIYLKDKIKNEGPIQTVSQLFPGFTLNTYWSFVNVKQRIDLDDPKFKYLVYLIKEKLNMFDHWLEKLAFAMPWIAKLVPWCDRKSKALKEFYSFIKSCIDERKLDWVKGQPRDLTDMYFDKVDETTDEKSSFHIKNNFQCYSIGDLFLGSAAPTGNCLEFLLFYLSRSPQVQEKLFKEIQTVIGICRRPSLCDRPEMPYACAIIQELLRTSTVVPLAVRRCSDTHFEGYSIPKGTVFFFNLHGIHHDPQIWGEDCDHFRPERWISNDKDQLKRQHDNFMPFINGVRDCPGAQISRDQIFLYMTTICQQFNLLPSHPDIPEPSIKFGVAKELAFFQLKFIERI